MNSYNRSLIKSIRIFFKTAYIILILLILIYTVLGIVQVFFPGMIDGIGMPFFFIAREPDLNITMSGEKYNALAMAGQGIIVMKQTPVIVPLINYLSSITILTFYLIIVNNVRLIIQSLSTNDIFTVINGRRLRRIAFLMLSSYVLNLIYQIIFNLYLKNSFHSNQIRLADWYVMDYQIGLVVSILFMFFIYSVFKVGTDIAEENKSFI